MEDLMDQRFQKETRALFMAAPGNHYLLLLCCFLVFKEGRAHEPPLKTTNKQQRQEVRVQGNSRGERRESATFSTSLSADPRDGKEQATATPLGRSVIHQSSSSSRCND